jgi:hypothetical protein
MLSPFAWLANKLYAIEEKGKDVANVCRHGPCLLSSTTVQTRVQCNDNSTRSYTRNQSVHRAVSKLVKTAINYVLTISYIFILTMSKLYIFNNSPK